MTRRPRPQDAPASSLVAPGAPGAPRLALDTTPPFRQTEKAFQASVERYARLMGWAIFHDVATNAPRACRHCKQPLNLPRNPAGFQDLLLIRPPRVVWAELKSERNRLTPDQRTWRDVLLGCGQEWYLWRPSSWPEIERVLR